VALAEEILRELVAARSAALGADHEDTVVSAIQLAMLVSEVSEPQLLERLSLPFIHQCHRFRKNRPQLLHA
jgi:hypothetical protein